MSGPFIREKHLEYTPFVYPCLEKTYLPKVTLSEFQKDFLDVLKERRSVKQLGGCAIEKLSEILFYAIKPYTICKDDYDMVVYQSASPSAGGRHPIDILVGFPGNEGRRLFLYEPLSHSLFRLDIPIEMQQMFFHDINQTLTLGESILVWFSIQYMRTASKYTDYESLIWRDVGAQLCCLQQVTRFVGLDSCPIGYLAEDTFGHLFNCNSLISGGGMIIGSKEINK